MTIMISTEWALTIMTTLIGTTTTLAWKASARFSAIETAIEWIKDAIKELKVNADNTASGNPAFAARSPLNLTSIGEIWLNESGLKNYIDTHPEKFEKICTAKKDVNPYELQNDIFKLFKGAVFDTDFDDSIKKFAFEKGTTVDVLRRVGAIYLRNICIEHLGMKREDIDKHDPLRIA